MLQQFAVLHWYIMVHQFAVIIQWHITVHWCSKIYLNWNILELKHNWPHCPLVCTISSKIVSCSASAGIQWFPSAQIKQNYGRNKTVGKVLLAAAQTDHYPFRAKKLLLLLSPAFAVVVTCCFCISWRCYYSRMLFLYIIIILFPH